MKKSMPISPLVKEATALSYRLHDLSVVLDQQGHVCLVTGCERCAYRRRVYWLKYRSYLRICRRATLARQYEHSVIPKGINNDRLRFEVFQRDNFTCQACGRTPKDGVPLEVDHIVPRSLGGSNAIDNLQVLCKQCNIGKKNRVMHKIDIPLRKAA